MTKVRRGRRKDALRVAEIFTQSFAASVAALIPGRMPTQEAFKDIFVFLIQASPQDFFVLEAKGMIQGYIVALAVPMWRLWARAVYSGSLLLWLGKWVLGRYHIPLSAVRTIVRNKLLFVGSEKQHSPPGRYGRILSVAVAHEARGMGFGTQLVRHGLEHLAHRGLDYVKLEVRPDNHTALRIYTESGFLPVGRTRDVQGDWLVMSKANQKENGPATSKGEGLEGRQE